MLKPTEATATAVESVVDIQSKETSSSDVADILVVQPKIEPHFAPSPAVRTEGGGNRRLFFVGGIAVVLLGYWLFGIVFKVQTPDGIIQIKTNITDVEIFVDNEKVVHITDPKDKTKIRVEIPKGAETLRVRKDGFDAVHLQDREVSDDDLELLSKCKFLRQADLRGTKVTAQGVAELQKALPNCNVQR